MPRRIVPLVAEECYHLYNRGVNRQKIFFERENGLFFLRRLREHFRSAQVIAYCLMPNHFHLLVRPLDDELSRQMQRFSISYTKAINQRYRRVGPLFQGQFQAVRVEHDEHLLHLSRYIHLNPVVAKLIRQPQEWEFSSYLDYVGLRHGTLPVPGPVLSQFPDVQAYRAFVEAYKPGDESAIAHLLLGDE